MASALDLVAAVGEAFRRAAGGGARSAAAAGGWRSCCACSRLLWACLWRGALRWGGAPFFAASVALYVLAPRPVAGFDGDLRAVYRARSDARLDADRAQPGARPTRANGSARCSGLSPPEIERLRRPKHAAKRLCVAHAGGRRVCRLCATEQASQRLRARRDRARAHRSAGGLRATLRTSPRLSTRANLAQLRRRRSIYETRGGLRIDARARRRHRAALDAARRANAQE